MEGTLKMGANGRPLQLYRTTVQPAWIDYNGHMTEGFYGVVFADASDELLTYIGFDDRYRREVGGSFYTVETHIRFLHELAKGDRLVVDTQLLGADRKRVHLFHTLRHESGDYAAAVQETMMVHVDMVAAAVTAMRADLQLRLAELSMAHDSLGVPDDVGRVIKPVAGG